ncbi:MAG: amino acid ABC transporter substrate-binding protein, partial [Aestuariibacter sp.]|nr:amino acid ABC transporter substrate-binding protein [Aestuariibacter sp.]
DYNQHKELDELEIENFPVNSDQIAVTMIANKRIEFAYVPQEAAAYQAKKLGLADNVKYKVFKSKKLHVCFSKKWPDIKSLVTKFNQSLADLKADGTYATIHARYGIHTD